MVLRHNHLGFERHRRPRPVRAGRFHDAGDEGIHPLVEHQAVAGLFLPAVIHAHRQKRMRQGHRSQIHLQRKRGMVLDAHGKPVEEKSHFLHAVHGRHAHPDEARCGNLRVDALQNKRGGACGGLHLRGGRIEGGNLDLLRQQDPFLSVAAHDLQPQFIGGGKNLGQKRGRLEPLPRRRKLESEFEIRPDLLLPEKFPRDIHALHREIVHKAGSLHQGPGTRSGMKFKGRRRLQRRGPLRHEGRLAENVAQIFKVHPGRHR